VDREIVDPDGLRDVLLRRLAEPGNEDVLVVVRADASAPHADVRKLLEDARAAGVPRLAIATRQKTEKKR
jgi:biopolymer transport protein ExbD